LQVNAIKSDMPDERIRLDDPRIVVLDQVL